MENSETDTHAFTLIYTADAMYLLRGPKPDWRDIQRHFAAYKSSLSFSQDADVLGFLGFEYPEDRGYPRWSSIMSDFANCRAVTCIRLTGLPSVGDNDV